MELLLEGENLTKYQAAQGDFDHSVASSSAKTQNSGAPPRKRQYIKNEHTLLENDLLDNYYQGLKYILLILIFLQNI